ncbi:hypothetical protein SMICM304S_00830 [Streptomyces microflavus]
MTDSAVAESCRLTVRAPSVTIDLAVPADVPVADLLPTLLRYVGEEAEEAGLDHAGWVLQRLGDAPLDEETTLAQAGLSDGAVLHLRPSTEALPEARLDDWSTGSPRRWAAGCTPGAPRRPGACWWGPPWRPWWPPWCWCSGPGWPIPPPSGPPARPSPECCCSPVRAPPAARSATGSPRPRSACWSPGASPWSAGCCPAATSPTAPTRRRSAGARLLAAGAAAAGGAVLALAATAVGAPALLATAVVAVATAVSGALMGYTGLDVPAAVALVATIVALAAGAVAPFAFKLAGMRMPSLPAADSYLVAEYGGDGVPATDSLGGAGSGEGDIGSVPATAARGPADRRGPGPRRGLRRC